MNNTLPSKMYLARAGGSGEDEEYALDNGVAIIGFREYPSLAKLSDYASVLALVKMTRPDLNPRVAADHAGQLWAFAVAMQEGDFVVLPRKLTAQLALGRVKGQYKYTKVGLLSGMSVRSSGFGRMRRGLVSVRTCCTLSAHL